MCLLVRNPGSSRRETMCGAFRALSNFMLRDTGARMSLLWHHTFMPREKPPTESWTQDPVHQPLDANSRTKRKKKRIRQSYPNDGPFRPVLTPRIPTRQRIVGQPAPSLNFSTLALVRPKSSGFSQGDNARRHRDTAHSHFVRQQDCAVRSARTLRSRKTPLADNQTRAPVRQFRSARAVHQCAPRERR